MFANRLAPDLFATQAMRRANAWRIATMLIEQFGNDASEVAAACTRALNEMGDVELSALWTRVGLSIAELQRTPQRAKEPLN